MVPCVDVLESRRRVGNGLGYPVSFTARKLAIAPSFLRRRADSVLLLSALRRIFVV